MSKRHELYRVILPDGELYRHDDGRTRFPMLMAAGIASRRNGRVVR